MKKDYKDLREFVKYGSLNMVGMMAIAFYILVDTFFVAQALGSNGLAALNIALPAFSFVSGIALCLATGGGALYSLKKEHSQTEANQVFTWVIKSAVFMMIMLILAGLLFSRPITVLIGGNGPILDMAHIYLKITLIGAPTLILFEIFLAFMRNDDHPKVAACAMFVGAAVNTLLDYIFIYPLNGGMLGAVLATVISPAIAFLVMLPTIFKGKTRFRFVSIRRLNERRLNGKSVVGKVVAMGIPSFIGEMVLGLATIVFNLILIDISGNLAVAVYGIVVNTNMCVVYLFNGLSQGVQPLFSRYKARGDNLRLRLMIKYGVTSSLLLAALVVAGIYAFPELITAAFNGDKDPVVQEMGKIALMLFFSATPIMALNIMASVYFSATDQAIIAQIISIMRGLILLVPIAFVMAYAVGLYGLWLTVTVTETLVLAGIGIFIGAKKIRTGSD